ncbi:tyrosine-type recombinase/integrase [Streptomyces sp. NPDC093591]|uniref:tyrosine-type recombinase/integrase n=1 Tax=Streptomyces sp. NPDC093591 TaxID=3366044 RepID=UPI00382BDBEC
MTTDLRSSAGPAPVRQGINAHRTAVAAHSRYGPGSGALWRAIKAAGSDELCVVIDLMHGCGHRNGEAYAANRERMVADDVYRITEQIEGETRQRAPLKHRKPGEFRETPMPWTVRESLLRYERKHGTDINGYFLRTQRSAYWAHTALDYHWGVAKKRAGIARRLTAYSLRHFFASNCLAKGIPITDVAEWMGTGTST